MTTPKFPILRIETNHTLYECVVVGPEEKGVSNIYFQGDLESGEEIVNRCNAFPALYAALEGLLDLHDACIVSAPDSCMRDHYRSEQIAHARAALALARGEKGGE